jgi:hypothetical protein
MLRFIATMQEANEKTIFFIEGMSPVPHIAGHPAWNENDPRNAVHAFHWYDGIALFTKRFRPWFAINPETVKCIVGRKKVQAYFTECLAKGAAWARENMGGIPSLLGEFGLAFDMNKRRAFADGDYSLHEEALSMYYDAVDANLLHSTIWNYSASNTNKYGDSWNDEDLSIFSEGKERAAAGWKRPYPMATAGAPLSFTWDRKKKIFVYRFTADNKITAPGIIYLPAGDGQTPQIEVATLPENLRWEYVYEEQRLLIYNDNYSGEAVVNVRLN